MTTQRRHGTRRRRAQRLGLIGLLMLMAPALAQAEDLEAAMAAKTGDYRTAITRWTTFAQQGDPDSAYRLGQAYEAGQGVPRDLHQAQYWYRARSEEHTSELQSLV